MPPAFILSQNQTLKFNCLKSLSLYKIITALTLLSLCWLCFLGYLKFNFSTLKKLTEITFHLLVCQIKSHFFLIPFLIFWNRTTVRACHFLGDSLYIIPHLISGCQAFFQTFWNFFWNFLNFFFVSSFSSLVPQQLVYITTLFHFCQTFFRTFLNFFKFF